MSELPPPQPHPHHYLAPCAFWLPACGTIPGHHPNLSPHALLPKRLLASQLVSLFYCHPILDCHLQIHLLKFLHDTFMLAAVAFHGLPKKNQFKFQMIMFSFPSLYPCELLLQPLYSVF